MGNQILLVENDVDLLESYEESLELSGYSVITSTNAIHGIELYQSNHPCIVFSDVKMDEMDGYELFSKIREFDSKAKVILVTGHEDKEKSFIAKNNGLLDVLNKPVSSQQILDLIKENDC